MSLFDVPDWNVSTKLTSSPQAASKKRKRKSGGEDKAEPIDLEEAARNVDKVMKQLESGNFNFNLPKQDNTGKKSKSSSGKRDRELEGAVGTNGTGDDHPSKKHKTSARPQSHPQPTPASQLPKPAVALPDSPKKEKKKEKRKEKKDKGPPRAEQKPESDEEAEGPPQPSPSKLASGLTPLQAKMKKSLDGAKFRLVNEALYTSESKAAHNMLRDDPGVFEEYHIGFRSQCASWPSNPVSHYISALSAYPKGTVIADLGCGDAALAKDLVPKGLVVLSYDLVSADPFVVEADICSKLPLPGLEDDQGSDKNAQIVDVCICSLSLMNTNWISCVREVRRVLKDGGEFKVAEVTSRITDIKGFTTLMKSAGFQLLSKDDSNSHFMLFEFKKAARETVSESRWRELGLKGTLLKACEYKRR